MTRAEWDALTSREKDAVVAEKVVGWPPMPVGVPGVGYRPRYTESWDAMREVVEKMVSLDYGVALDGGSYDGTGVFGWECAFCPHGEEAFPDEAPTAPEAVCIAALAALGHMEAA